MRTCMRAPVQHTDNEFVFRKIWTGYTETPPKFTWTLYRNGEAADPQHQFVLDDQGLYHAYDMRDGDYYLIENVPKDFVAIYHNVGPHQEVTDRLYSGGILENVYVPQTGDQSDARQWLISLGVSALALAVLGFFLKKKKKHR